MYHKGTQEKGCFPDLSQNHTHNSCKEGSERRYKLSKELNFIRRDVFLQGTELLRIIELLGNPVCEFHFIFKVAQSDNKSKVAQRHNEKQYQCVCSRKFC